MSPPNASGAPGRRLSFLRLLWVIILLGISLLMFFRNGPPRTVARSPVTNTAGALSLADFTSAETHRWRTAPRGTQVCDGVTFVCQGAIRTAGWNAARDGNRYPGAVLGLPVNRSGARIHLLQAAENSLEAPDGTPYGRLMVHYANGETRRFELLLGVHGDDWLQGKHAPSNPVADPNSRVGWLQRRTGDGMWLRLYHSVLENPLPKVTIATVDFISPLSDPNLLLFGLTLDDDPRPLAASYGPGESIEEAVSDAITFTLQDATGRPMSGATLTWHAQGRRARIDFPPFPADALGQATIEIPRRGVRAISYEASARDGSITSGELKPEPSGAFPPRPVLKLTSP